MKNIKLLSLETGFKNRFYCCLESLKGNYKSLLIFLLFMGSFSQGISAQGTLVPACNLVGPLVACAVANPSDTSGDIVINLEVARSGAPNLADAQHNLNFVYTFPTNSAGAFIRSYGNVVYNPVTNRTTQSIVVFPGTSVPEFNLQVNVTNTTSAPSTICECSKSVSVSRVAATSSFTPIACFGGLSTLTVVGSLSDLGTYTYTLLPSGPSNSTGIFPNLPGSVAGITYTVNVESAEGCTTTTSQTILQPALNPVVLNCPEPGSISACQSQSAITAAFNAWLLSFNFTGGTNPHVTTSPITPVLPPLCGGSTQVTWTVTDDCGQPQSCTRTFTITPDTIVPVITATGTPTNGTLGCNPTAAQINAALGSATATDNCGPLTPGFTDSTVTSDGCFRSQTRTWNVSDACGNAALAVSRTATWTQDTTAPVIVAIGTPTNGTLGCNPTADQIGAALGSATATDNCGPVTPTFTDSTVTSNGCNRSQTRTWNVSDACGNAAIAVSRTATWIVSTPVVFTCGNDVTLPACSTQEQITAAWNAFLTSTTASGGCGGVLTRTDCPAPPVCGGFVDITWTYTVAACGEGNYTCTRRFTVGSTSEVLFNCGTDVTISGCGSQTAVDTAWYAFLASTTASGGCNGVFSRTTANSPSACGGSVNVTWTYTTTSCGGAPSTQTCTRTFTVTPSAPVTITPGNDVTLAACSTQAQLDAAWNAFLISTTATGGCTGALTTSAATAPSLCGGYVDVTWTYTVASCGSSCGSSINTQTITRRFTVLAPEVAVPVLTCPTNIEIAGGQTPQQISAAFATWLATASANGGCNGVLTNNHTGVPACGTTATVIFTYTTTCAPFTTSCTATFTVPSCVNGSIGDFVWNDLNQNGIQDAGEPGIAGVSVSLSGAAAMNTTTNGNGAYLFSNLPAGNYTVTFVTPSGHTASLANQGANDGVDSDSVGGVASGIILANAQNNLTIDAGFYIPASSGLEGCTLGYWKNHTNRWCESYRTCDRFGDVFTSSPASLANLTLLEALNLGGGGIYNLARQGVAALLNACSGEVEYAGYEDDPQSVIDAVNNAYENGKTTSGSLASQLDVLNNTGCPLGGTRATSATNCTEVDDKIAPKMKVLLYPNPTDSNFNLELTTQSNDKVSVAIYDMLGRPIDKQELDPRDSLEVKFGAKYPTGVYNVVVTQGTDVKTLRVIKR
ncbi:SdrD B-like domain-containing protein [Flavobacterium sp.]|uniref:SdrD B-like domain-containing protein n=1 Tax=Flavobacterium sp. TaxID=239 RepID=UPI0032654E84